MPVATPCTAYGFQVIGGSLAPLGPRPLAWPNANTCNIDANNGLKYDPVTGKMWTSPDMQVTHFSASGSIYNMNPTFAGTKAIDSISISATSRLCTGSTYTFDVTGGLGNWLLAPGNAWDLHRGVGIFIDNVGVGLGDTMIQSFGNGAGQTGNAAMAAVADSYHLCGELTPGQNIRFALTYSVDVRVYTAGVGVFNWVPPQVELAFWSHG